MVHDLTTPVSGMIRWLGLASINLPTKFEVSISSHHEDMKRSAKLEKWVVWGSYGSLKVTKNIAIRQSAYEFLLVFHRNYK